MSEEVEVVPVVQPELTPEEKLARTLAGHKCKREWVWLGGIMTDEAKCMTCGVVTTLTKFKWEGQ